VCLMVFAEIGTPEREEAGTRPEQISSPKPCAAEVQKMKGRSTLNRPRCLGLGETNESHATTDRSSTFVRFLRTRFYPCSLSDHLGRCSLLAFTFCRHFSPSSLRARLQPRKWLNELCHTVTLDQSPVPENPRGIAFPR
jgi:hypothetical protein